MGQGKDELSVSELEDFVEAWNNHDIDTIMAYMSDDCVFETGGGTASHGTRYQGAEAVRARFIQVWTDIPDSHFGEARHFVSGNRGLSEWIYTGTKADGSKIILHGCDIFTFQEGKITVKNTYMKNRRSAE